MPEKECIRCDGTGVVTIEVNGGRATYRVVRKELAEQAA